MRNNDEKTQIEDIDRHWWLDQEDITDRTVESTERTFLMANEYYNSLPAARQRIFDEKFLEFMGMDHSLQQPDTVTRVRGRPRNDDPNRQNTRRTNSE